MESVIEPSKRNGKAILSSLYTCGVGSLSFLLSMLVAAFVALIILFCFFNIIMFVISILIIVIVFLSVLAGTAFILFGGIFMIYSNYINT